MTESTKNDISPILFIVFGRRTIADKFIETVCCFTCKCIMGHQPSLELSVITCYFLSKFMVLIDIKRSLILGEM